MFDITEYFLAHQDKDENHIYLLTLGDKLHSVEWLWELPSEVEFLKYVNIA